MNELAHLKDMVLNVMVTNEQLSLKITELEQEVRKLDETILVLERWRNYLLEN